MAVTNFQLAVQFMRRKSFVGLGRKYRMTSEEVQARFRVACDSRQFKKWMRRRLL